jgi:hypothetical protein
MTPRHLTVRAIEDRPAGYDATHLTDPALRGTCCGDGAFGGSTLRLNGTITTAIAKRTAIAR